MSEMMNEVVNEVAENVEADVEKENKNMRDKLCNTFTCDMETAEYLRQMANAYGIPKAVYVRRIIKEDMERKKDVLEKIEHIKNLQEEIRQMEEERKKLEQIVTAMMAKMEEVKKLQEEIGVA